MKSCYPLTISYTCPDRVPVRIYTELSLSNANSRPLAYSIYRRRVLWKGEECVELAMCCLVIEF